MIGNKFMLQRYGFFIGMLQATSSSGSTNCHNLRAMIAQLFKIPLTTII